KDPLERYPSCGELVQATREALGIAAPRRARWPFLVAGVGAAILGVALVAFALDGGSSNPPPVVHGNSVASIDPHSNHVVASVPVGASPDGIAFGASSLWVANLEDQTVSRVDPRTYAVVRTLPVVDTPTGIATSGGAVWVVGSDPARSTVSVRRID